MKEIKTTLGTVIDSIRLTFQHKNDLIQTPIFGRTRTKKGNWIVPDGEYITKITLFAGGLVDALMFETNKGTVSPKIGGSGGKEYIIEVPQGYRLGGIFGRG